MSVGLSAVIELVGAAVVEPPQIVVARLVLQLSFASSAATTSEIH